MIASCSCSTVVEAKLNVEKNEVECQNCGKEIEMTEFMKNTMKMNSDVVRPGNKTNVPEGGMRVECLSPKCNNKFAALLSKKDDKCYCPKCNNIVELSSFSTAMLRENGQYVGMVEAREMSHGLDINDGTIDDKVEETPEV